MTGGKALGTKALGTKALGTQVFESSADKKREPLAPFFIFLLSYSSGAITRLTIAMTLMRMFMEGPEVSLNGSPTVSPTTAAA